MLNEMWLWMGVALVAVWTMTYAFDPFNWEFVSQGGGGFLRGKRRRGGAPAPPALRCYSTASGQEFELGSKLSSQLDEILKANNVQTGIAEMGTSPETPEAPTPLIVFPQESKYVELAHHSIRLRARDKRNYVVPAVGGLLGRLPPHAEIVRLATEMGQVVKEQEWDFDTICTLSTTTLPLAYAYLFIVRHDLNLVACDNITGRFLPDAFFQEKRERRVLLLDAVVQTGSHAERAWKAIRESGSEVIGFIAAHYNDLPGQRPGKFLSRVLNTKRAFYLSTVSSHLSPSTVAMKGRRASTS